jgi:hypothetical protein
MSLSIRTLVWAFALTSVAWLGCDTVPAPPSAAATPSDTEPGDIADDTAEDAAPDSEDNADGSVDAENDAENDAVSDTPSDTDLDAASDASPDVTPIGPGLCGSVTPSPRTATGPGSNPGAPIPFGVGQSDNTILGLLEDASMLAQPVGTGAVRTNEDLLAVPYDVYVPEAYDGSEPYGLIVFINSGDNGGGPNNSYRALLDSGRFIHVAPDGAGNSVNVDVRMGRGLMGTLRAMELFNIDETRVYTMGNSGGARSAHMLMYQYPQLYAGSIPRCGANYPREVDQDYETREPDGHYEFWGAFFFPALGGQPYIDALRGFERRFALMTSFDDFREGDVMNIYHNGMEQDGLNSRLIQTTGAHCATNEAHFYDALGYVQHPLFALVSDDFEDGELGTSAGPGAGVVLVSGDVTEEGGALVLDGSAETAAVLVADRLSWLDWHGLVARQSVTLEGAETKSLFSLRPYDPAVHTVDPTLASTVIDGGTEIRIEVRRSGEGGSLHVRVQPDSDELVNVLDVTFDDWPASSAPIDLRVDLWDAELQIDTGWHLQEPTTIADGALLLNDRRTIRIRWSELLRGGEWAAAAWADGAVLGLSARDGTVRVHDVAAQDGVGFRCE